MNALEISGAQKSFGARCALRGLDLVVPRAEAYLLVGRSGVGKTTALGAACGLVPLDAGTVKAFGRPLKDSAARIGAVVGKPAFLPGAGVRANLQAKAGALGVPDVRSTCDKLIERLGLADFADERADSLSLGATQWLGLALALVGSPDLLLLDDPFAGVDPQGRADMLALVEELRDREGMSFVIAAQEAGPFAGVVARCGIMADGLLVKEFAAEELDLACKSVAFVRTNAPERTLSQLELAFPEADFLIRDGGRIEASGVGADELSEALFSLPERIVELSEQRRSLDDLVTDVSEKRR